MNSQYRQIENSLIKTILILVSVIVKSKDELIAQTINREMVFLFSDTMKFMKDPNDNNYKMVVGGIESLLKLFAVTLGLGKMEQLEALLVEKDLLSLRLAVNEEFVCQRKADQSHQKIIPSLKIQETEKGTMEDRMMGGSMQEEILDFINSKKEVANIDIFINFRQFNRRSIKRNLSRLVAIGQIVRKSEGKKVYYISKIIRNSNK